MTRAIVWNSLLILGLTATACGDPKSDDSKSELEAMAKTALNSEGDEATRKAREADEARRKEEFATQKKKADEESAAYDAKMAEIITLPEKMPKNVDTACKDLLDSYHEFILKSYENDDGAILDWYNNRKASELGERRGKCVKIDSLEATACQIHALGAAPSRWREKQLDIIARCVEKYAPGKAEAAAKADAASLAKATKRVEAKAADGTQGG